ncbi:MAG: antibiotic biosynthesis monooxygenase [Gammaproteobacteria bacterium]|jgi:hypothetical protein
MITRIWHGWTAPDKADDYERLLRTDILPGIREQAGESFHGVQLLRQPGQDEVEFVTIMWFDSLDGVRKFAGDNHERAVVPDRAQAVLSRYDDTVRHYEVKEHLTP